MYFNNEPNNDLKEKTFLIVGNNNFQNTFFIFWGISPNNPSPICILKQIKAAPIFVLINYL